MLKKLFLIIIFATLLIPVFTGCKTTSVLQSGSQPKGEEYGPADEVRGIILYPESFFSGDTLLMRRDLNKIVERLADANFNVVFFFFREKPGLVPLVAAVAKQKNLKIFAGITTEEMAEQKPGSDTAETKSRLKKYICNLSSEWDIDGFSFTASGMTIDVLEDMVAEAMLAKPYLVNSLIFKGDVERRLAEECLKERFIDLIIPETKIRIFDNYNSLPVYSGKKRFTPDVKKTRPEQVIGLDFSSYLTGNPGGQKVYINDRVRAKVTDSQGCIEFVASGSDSIKIRTADKELILQTRDWSLPYRYSVQPDGKATRKSPWVEFRSVPSWITDLPEYDFLCKTDYPAEVKINGIPLKQYRTGIFFNKVRFNDGPNRVRATVLTKDSLSVFYEPEFIYEKVNKTRKQFPLWIDEKSVEPSYDLEMLSDDIVKISFRGSMGQEAYVSIQPGGAKIACSRKDFTDYSLYLAELPLQNLTPGKKYKLVLKIMPVRKRSDSKSYELELHNYIIVRNPNEFPLVTTIRDNARLTYNLGEPRLGGPIRSEFGKGVVMKTSGKMGNNYRIRLSNVENGIINKNDVETLPEGSLLPRYFIEDLSCGPGPEGDILSIPYLSPGPYEVHPDPDQNRIVVTLFGAETSSTWVTHRSGRKIIDRVTWRQTTPETYQVFVRLRSSKIWGYDLRPEGKRLVLRIKYPPAYDLKNEKPLTGLKIAIEAGHGGSGSGAIGLSGLVEKDINLDLSFRLGELCRSMGAEIIQVRDSDRDMTLIEKRNIPITSRADLLICIHANAGGRGYLSTSGTSTYYHNPFWAPMAEAVYQRLLELGLKEFGVVGSFNYTVTRVSQMPAILVEQAFLTNAEDEEKLADPLFRQQEAQKILEGIIDYLKVMKE